MPSKRDPAERPPWYRRIAQFRLSTLLAVITISACVFGIRQRVRQHHAAQMKVVAELTSLGASVGLTPKGPRLVNRFIGPDLYRRVVDVDMQRLRHLTNNDLRVFRKLESCEKLYLADTRIGDAGLAHIRNLKGLKRLSLWGTEVTDAGMPYVENFDELRAIDLANSHVGNDGLKYLSGKTELRFIGFSNRMSDRGLKHIAHLKNLEKIDVNSSGISARGLTTLQTKKLKIIDYDHGYKSLLTRNAHLLTKFKMLEHLPYENAFVNDEQIPCFTNMSQLQELSIQGYNLTDASIPYLLKMSFLKRLVIRDSMLSSSGVQRLSRELPRAVSLSVKRSEIDPMTIHSPKEGRRSITIRGNRLSDEHRREVQKIDDIGGVYLNNSTINNQLLELFAKSQPSLLVVWSASIIDCDFQDCLPSLERIYLKASLVDESSIESIAKLPHLRKLELLHCDLPDNAISALANATSLREFALGGFNSNTASLKAQHVDDLNQLDQIEILDLSMSDVTPQEFGKIAPKNLKKLRKNSAEKFFNKDEK